MTHKVHPKSFRIKGMEDWSIRGFYGKRTPQYLQEDISIKEFLKEKLAEASVASVEIEHSANKLNIIIETARPGLIIGRGGGGVEKIKELVEKKLLKIRKEKSSFTREGKGFVRPAGGEVKIEIKEIRNPWISSALVAQWVAQQIEKRIPFRQVLKRGIERVMANREVKGIRIEVAGRLNGIEIARKEWLKQGRLPRNTLRADIDYSQGQAYCTYGTIGIKVWIYKGEKFE